MTERRSPMEFIEGLAFGAVGVILGLIGSMAPWLFLLFIPAIIFAVLQDMVAGLLFRKPKGGTRRTLRSKGTAFVLTPAIGGLIAGALWGMFTGASA